FFGIMSLLMVGRMVRAEEESGRLELIRSLPVGRHAPVTSAAIVVGSMAATIGLVTTLGWIALGLPATGSISYGLGLALFTMVIAAIALVTNQVTENTRLANGIAGAALGASFLLRAVGDLNDGTLSWLSPMGWVTKAQPFADERWWPMLVPLAAIVGLWRLAHVLGDHRDLGAGLIAPRPGRARASATLSGTIPLAVRLQRGLVIGWSAGVAFLALAYGAITATMEEFIDDNPQMGDFLAMSGQADFTDAYLAAAVRITALIASGFALQSILRLHGEEVDGHAEDVLATATSRWRYWGSHVVLAVGGSVVVLAVAALVMGVSAAVSVGDASLTATTVEAMAAYLPATLVLIGLGAAAVGFLPRRATWAWAVLAVAFVVEMFGPLLDLPAWAMRISPFQSVPQLPADPFELLPVVALTAAGAALIAASALRYRHRDLPA
ncbi:MAG: hypothetical protein KDA97_12120, partial [Acidimicrobiales bacterium]|nr:hypothetical protein [Acidimicrobiales bacterium]